MASKKGKIVKLLLIVVAIGGAGFFAWKKFFERDKYGGQMKLIPYDSDKQNVEYNGVKIPGSIQPGTLKIISGYYTGVGSDGKTYQFKEGSWFTM